MILVVQRSAMYRQHISDSLKSQGWDVTCVNSFEDARDALREQTFELVLPDVDLGERSGFELCRIIHSQQQPAPVVIFVATDSCTADRVLGFDLGALDFISYPCHARELQVRVKAHLRYTHRTEKSIVAGQDDPGIIRCGCVAIDDRLHEVTVSNQLVYLTATEFTLLRHLCLHPNQVFSRLQLLDAVWGYQHSGYEHTVNSHINRLRSKLTGQAATMIETVWGVGYKLRVAGVAQPSRGPAAVVPLRQSI